MKKQEESLFSHWSPLIKLYRRRRSNWGRIVMAIGKSEVTINLNKLSIKFGELTVVQKGKLHNSYDENETSYMKNSNIDITIDLASGIKNFTAYTMDLTKKYGKLILIIEVKYIEIF